MSRSILGGRLFTAVLVSGSAALSCTGAVAASSPIAWYIYSADQRPDKADAVRIPGGDQVPFNDVTHADGHMRVDGKGILWLDNSIVSGSSYAKFRMPYGSSYPRHLTLVARVVGNVQGTRATDLEVVMAPNEMSRGVRVKTIIAESGLEGLEVEKFDGDNSATHNLNTLGSHIYQIAITQTGPDTGSFSVYVDGDKKPLLSRENVKLRAASKAGDNFIGMGINSSSATYQSSIDWVVWTPSGAFTPQDLHGRLPRGIGNIVGY